MIFKAMLVSLSAAAGSTRVASFIIGIGVLRGMRVGILGSALLALRPALKSSKVALRLPIGANIWRSCIRGVHLHKSLDFYLRLSDLFAGIS